MSISPEVLQKQMESTILTMLPTISEELKFKIRDMLAKEFANGSSDVKSTTESSLKQLDTKETQILSTIKEEMTDIKNEISVAGADMLKVVTKNVGELADKLNIDPRFKTVLLSLPGLRDEILNGVDEAKKHLDELNKLKSETVKDNHAITISAVNLIMGIVITSITVLSTIVGLIIMLKGG